MQVARSSLQQCRQPQHPPLSGGSFRLLSFTVAMARDPLTDEVWMWRRGECVCAWGREKELSENSSIGVGVTRMAFEVI